MSQSALMTWRNKDDIESVMYTKDSLGRNWNRIKETTWKRRRKRENVRIRDPEWIRKDLFLCIRYEVYHDTHNNDVWTISAPIQSHHTHRWRTPDVPLHQYRTLHQQSPQYIPYSPSTKYTLCIDSFILLSLSIIHEYHRQHYYNKSQRLSLSFSSPEIMNTWSNDIIFNLPILYYSRNVIPKYFIFYLFLFYIE